MNLTIFGDNTASAQGVADALNSGLTADAFWGALQPFMPVIITTTLVALTFFLIRKVIKKFAKGRPV